MISYWRLTPNGGKPGGAKAKSLAIANRMTKPSPFSTAPFRKIPGKRWSGRQRPEFISVAKKPTPPSIVLMRSSGWIPSRFGPGLRRAGFTTIAPNITRRSPPTNRRSSLTTRTPIFGTNRATATANYNGTGRRKMPMSGW